MMSTWQIVGVILLAVLVGAIVPALLQLRRTLRSAEDVFRSTGPRLDRALDEVTEAATRINRLGKGLEKDAEGLGVFTDAAAGFGRSLKQAQESLQMMTTVGAAVGPAIAAGLKALFSQDRDEDEGTGPTREEGTVAAGGAGDGRARDERISHE